VTLKVKNSEELKVKNEELVESEKWRVKSE
jgi:hypothetical protein